MQDWQSAGFGVYIHWPFCLHKCPYCDFNSHVSAKVDQSQWAQALVQEITRTAKLVPDRRVDSVFFGGGTPSLMPGQTVAAIIDAIDRVWHIKTGAEITLEANPTSVEAVRFGDYAKAGVNRVSLGVQALNDADLKALGRMHSVAEARQAFDMARKIFARVSFDLIYARQNQTLSAWESELTEALRMAADHLSLYQLTIEDGTRFGEMKARGILRGLPSDDLAADLYQLTQGMTESAGLPGYEISNHAKPGAEGRHNLIYWRYGDFAGIGPGAHGRLTIDGQRFATNTHRDPATWLQAVQHGSGEMPAEIVTPADQACEYLLMSLRLAEGSNLDRFQALGGTFNARSVQDLESEGFLHRSGNIIQVSKAGRSVLNAVMARVVA